MGKSKIKIGVDPGSKKSGIAVMLNGKYLQLHYLTYFELEEFIVLLPTDVEFYVEDPESMNFVYSALQNKSEGVAYGQRIARNIGNVQHAGRMIIELLKNKGFSVKPVKPQRGLTKKTKKNARFFNRITKWEKRSNEHNRDAAMLIYKFYKD